MRTHPHDTTVSSAEGADRVAAENDPLWIPNRSLLWWPALRALRDIGRAATDDEITEHIADSMSLSQQQRVEMTPSGQRTKLRTRVGWAVHELKEIDAVHHPERGYRALTPLGYEVDEGQIKTLRAAFEANTTSSGVEEQQGWDLTDAPTVWGIRAGRQGERYDHNLEHGLAGVSFGFFLDLRTVLSRDELKDALRSQAREAGNRTISNHAGQLWRMRTDVRVGDLVVMPCPGSRNPAQV